jgi:hypothetical protein
VCLIEAKKSMILLISTSSRARDCAAALEHYTGQKIQVASSVARGLAMLQAREYEVLVVDESLAEIDDSAIDMLLNQAGLAMPIYVNLGIHRTERIVREVQAGLVRKQAEHLVAKRSAQRLLRSELRGDITGILLASELALREAELSPQIAVRINSVYKLAEQIRSRLQVAEVR